MLSQDDVNEGGMICCDICMGTSDEAKAYLDAKNNTYSTKKCKFLEKH